MAVHTLLNDLITSLSKISAPAGGGPTPTSFTLPAEPPIALEDLPVSFDDALDEAMNGIPLPTQLKDVFDNFKMPEDVDFSLFEESGDNPPKLSELISDGLESVESDLTAYGEDAINELKAAGEGYFDSLTDQINGAIAGIAGLITNATASAIRQSSTIIDQLREELAKPGVDNPELKAVINNATTASLCTANGVSSLKGACEAQAPAVNDVQTIKTNEVIAEEGESTFYILPRHVATDFWGNKILGPLTEFATGITTATFINTPAKSYTWEEVADELDLTEAYTNFKLHALFLQQIRIWSNYRVIVQSGVNPESADEERKNGKKLIYQALDESGTPSATLAQSLKEWAEIEFVPKSSITVDGTYVTLVVDENY